MAGTTQAHQILANLSLIERNFTLARDMIGSSVIGGVIVIRKAVDCFFLAL
jgi:hypothetical protein